MADSLEITYFYGNDCGVCAASRPRVQALADEYQVPMITKFIEEHVAEAAQNLIFTIPALIIRRGDHEIHRQVRLIDFHQLERVLARETNE